MDLISKPAESDLQGILEQATAGQTLEAWKKKFLAGLKAILTKDPTRYRAYGPYWWPLKKVYIDQGDLAFGESVDLEWLEAMDYGKPELNIIAAHAYEEVRICKNMVDDPFHVMETVDGSDSVEFASDDPEMEMKGFLLKQ